MRKAAELLAGKAAVAQINTEENQTLAQRFGVRGIPLLCLLRNGKVVARLSGAQTAEAIVSWVQRQ